MKRLAAMHDWPLFCTRAVTAVRTATSRSAEGSTMNGSEPPSSSTLFFNACPAVAATDMPAFSLPVRVTAAIRGSSMIAAMSLLSTKRLVKAPSGSPARRKMSSRRSAVCGTLDACLSSPTLPTMSAGAAKRTTCHSGKFQGMMANTDTDRLVVHVRARGAVVMGSSASSDSACSANHRRPSAHLDASPRAEAKVLPISVVTMRAMSGASPSNRSAALIR